MLTMIEDLGWFKNFPVLSKRYYGQEKVSKKENIKPMVLSL